MKLEILCPTLDGTRPAFANLLKLKERKNPRPIGKESKRKKQPGKKLSRMVDSQKLMESLLSSASDHEAIQIVVINTFEMC